MIKLCFLIGLVTQKPMRANVNPLPDLPSTPCTVKNEVWNEMD